jgi:transcriptional regulator with XRE-family HTH domain
MQSVGTLLWGLRHSARLTLGELARRSGVSKATLSRWESGERLPRIPELEAVLSALNTDSSQRSHLLAAIEAPRAVRHLRHTAVVPPPTTGELLRALRHRKGWSPERLASVLKVSRVSVVRWEHGERIPSNEQIQAICYALSAREDELIAMTCGRLRTSRPTGPATIEDIELTLRGLKFGLYRGMEELVLWTLERQAWELLAHIPTVLPLLAEVYLLNGHHNSVHRRWSEIPAFTDKASALMGDLPEYPHLRIRVEILRATAAVYEMTTPYTRRGLYILSSVLELAKEQPEYHAWVLSDMANYLEMEGQIGSALELSVKAVSVAEMAENPIEFHLRRMDYGDQLIRAGRSADALRVLPTAELIGPEALLVQAEAEYHVGNLSEAANLLQQAIELIERKKLPHLRSRANALAARF